MPDQLHDLASRSLHWLEYMFGVDAPLQLFVAITLGLHFFWIIVYPFHHMYQFDRTDTRWKFLRYEKEWPDAWWHYPHSDTWNIAEHMLVWSIYAAALLEVWWLITKVHGERHLRRGNVRRDNE